MRIFLTGANGFIGGAVASALIADGHRVRGLVRDQAKADAVAAHGVDAVLGTLDDAALLAAEARAADAVVNAASSDHRGAVEALLAGLAGSGKSETEAADDEQVLIRSRALVDRHARHNGVEAGLEQRRPHQRGG